jgi:hypothetical protein
LGQHPSAMGLLDQNLPLCVDTLTVLISTMKMEAANASGTTVTLTKFIQGKDSRESQRCITVRDHKQ